MGYFRPVLKPKGNNSGKEPSTPPHKVIQLIGELMRKEEIKKDAWEV